MIIIILICVILLLRFFYLKDERRNLNPASNSGDYINHKVKFPNPEKCNDYRFYNFVQGSSGFILKHLLPEMKKNGYKLKPEFESAILQQIETGNFKNPYKFKDFYGTSFDVICLSFLKGTESDLSAFKISLSFVQERKLADTWTSYFSPPEKIQATKRFEKSLEKLELELDDINYFTFNLFWSIYEIEIYFRTNIIAFWDEEQIDVFKKVLSQNNIDGSYLRWINLSHIAKENYLPTTFKSLLVKLNIDYNEDDELTDAYADIASELIGRGIDLTKYAPCTNPKPIKLTTTENLKNDKLLSFIAIDVETAQGPRWSICQIGIVKVENGEIKETFSHLVRPPENIYFAGNTRVHGITPQRTIDSPLFPEIWKEIEPLIEGNLIVAHNAAFDIDCLKQTLEYYNLEIPNFYSDCTYLKTGKKLKDLCSELNITISNHHDALSDAIACAKAYLYLEESSGLHYSSNIVWQRPKGKGSNSNNNKTILKGDILKPNLSIENKENPFFNKKVVFTGVLGSIDRQKAAETIYKMGADIDTAITKRTDYVVLGSNPGPAKIDKINSFNKDGSQIKVLSEEEFMRMITNNI